jgi:hypothetical protein
MQRRFFLAAPAANVFQSSLPAAVFVPRPVLRLMAASASRIAPDTTRQQLAALMPTKLAKLPTNYSVLRLPSRISFELHMRYNSTGQGWYPDARVFGKPRHSRSPHADARAQGCHSEDERRVRDTERQNCTPAGPCDSARASQRRNSAIAMGGLAGAILGQLLTGQVFYIRGPSVRDFTPRINALGPRPEPPIRAWPLHPERYVK